MGMVNMYRRVGVRIRATRRGGNGRDQVGDDENKPKG